MNLLCKVGVHHSLYPSNEAWRRLRERVHTDVKLCEHCWQIRTVKGFTGRWVTAWVNKPSWPYLTWYANPIIMLDKPTWVGPTS